VLRLRIQLFVLVPQLIDLGGEFVDAVHALAQQDFQSSDMALLVC